MTDAQLMEISIQFLNPPESFVFFTILFKLAKFYLTSNLFTFARKSLISSMKVLDVYRMPFGLQ